jgi:hypothetical protein
MIQVPPKDEEGIGGVQLETPAGAAGAFSSRRTGVGVPGSGACVVQASRTVGIAG